MTDTLRIGTLGAAKIAPPAIVKPARAVDGVELVAVAARDRARAESFASKHSIPRVLDSYDDLVADPQIDAIYNPLPNGLHGAWTIRALEAGKHVLCEKPFTANADEARMVAKVAADTGLVAMEAFHWRYHPLATRLLEIVEREELGTLRHVGASMCAPLLSGNDIRWQLDLAGGSLMDMGCYPVSFVRVMTGEEPEVVSAVARERTPGIDRFLRADLRFPSGVTATIRCGMLSARVIDVSGLLVGDRGRVRVLNPFAPHYFSRVRVRTDAGRRVEKPTRIPTYDFQLQAFRNAVREGMPIPTGPDFAIANMEVIDAIYTAAGLGLRTPTPVT
jgi:predicted dehydrogenase